MLRIHPFIRSAKRSFWSLPNISFTPNLNPEPVNLFTNPDINCRTNVYSDKEYGGQSCCSYSSPEEEERILRFSGSLRFQSEDKILDDEEKERERAKKGYCSLKVHYESQVDLRDYEGVEVMIRSKKDQQVIINMQCFSYAKGDMYQLIFDIKGYENAVQPARPLAFYPQEDGWVKFYAPFSVFRLTIRGHPTEQQRLNDSLQLEAMGLLVSGEGEQDFEIDVLEMKAIKEIPFHSRYTIKANSFD